MSGKIFTAIPAIMAEVGSIAKARENRSQGYSFRGVDDVYLALQALLAKHGVFTAPTVLSDRTEDRTSTAGKTLIYRVLTIKYTFIADDGSCFDCTVIGEGMDSGDKASNKAMSVAHKYALLQVFCIPTDEPKDPENDSHEVVDNSGVYKATDAQKGALAELCGKKYPGMGIPDYRIISARMMNRPMTDVAAVIDVYAKENQGDK